VESPHQLLYRGVHRAAVSPTWPLRIPEPCLSDNNISSGEVGVSANHRSLSNRASRVCWIGKPGGTVAY